MLYGELCDEQYEPELEELEKSDHSLDRPCIRECKSCLKDDLNCKKFEDKCIGCSYRYTDPSKCENC